MLLIPMPVRRLLGRTPLYPVYKKWAPRARAFRDRSRRRAGDWVRERRGLPPAPPPLPPPRLVELVAGNTDPDWFLTSGRNGADSILALLDKHGLPWSSLGTVLDFGCGVGRVLRYWSGLQGPRVYGTDYNPELVAWCRQHLLFAKFNVNPLQGRLPYASARFDFIYALSVLTHLPPEKQAFWMAELGRILKPGGHLLISTHGEFYLQYLTAEDQAAFRAGQHVTLWEEFAGTNVCSTYHPPGYVREHLITGFALVDYVPEGALGNPKQDYWLLRKPA